MCIRAPPCKSIRDSYSAACFSGVNLDELHGLGSVVRDASRVPGAVVWIGSHVALEPSPAPRVVEAGHKQRGVDCGVVHGEHGRSAEP